MKNDKIYRELRKKYSDKELVESNLLPPDLSKKEQKELAVEMREIRLKKLRESKPEDKVIADVMRMRFEIEGYIRKQEYSFEKSFGKYLEEYIRILKKTRREIAEDLSIHYTKLSRIINDKEEPNVGLTYRLEKHSGNLIKAGLWWNLIVKKQEYIILKDDKTRKIEQRKVKNYIRA